MEKSFDPIKSSFLIFLKMKILTIGFCVASDNKNCTTSQLSLSDSITLHIQ